MTNNAPNTSEKVRLDRWLWAARFFKTRQNAVSAIKRGNITVNGARAKPAKMLSINDRLHIRKNPFDYEVTVLTLAEKRVSVKLAQDCYSESEQSMASRQARQKQVLENRESLIARKPNKKDRRTRVQLKRNSQL